VRLGDHPYGVAAVLYAVIVMLVGGVVYLFGPGHRDYLATRELVVNHRIVPGDFRSPDTFTSLFGFYLPAPSALEGKYVRNTTIQPNHPIPAASLGDGPNLSLLSLSAGEEVLVFPLAAETRLVALLDAGTSVAVIGQDDDKGAVLFEATVHAVQCDPKKGEPPACRAILRLSFKDPKEQPKLPKDLTSLKLALRPPPSVASEKKP
jgi:hypothetical protein